MTPVFRFLALGDPPDVIIAPINRISPPAAST
jgi:hypothetical protein